MTQHDVLYLHLVGSTSAYLAWVALFEMWTVNFTQLAGICACLQSQDIG